MLTPEIEILEIILFGRTGITESETESETVSEMVTIEALK